MNKHLQMDWIDGILIALGFSVGIELGYLFPPLLSIASEISLVAAFGAPTLRRAVFGAPTPGTPKEGPIWRLCSIFGLLIIFLSVPFFWIGSIAIQQSKEPMPDFRSEVLQEEAEWSARFQEVDSMLNAVVVPAGTSQEEIDRLTAEKKAQQEKEKIQKREGTISGREKEFVQRKEERFQEGLQTFFGESVYVFWVLYY